MITIVAVQAEPLSARGLPVFGASSTLDAFAAHVAETRAAHTGETVLLAYPELHLFGTEELEPAEQKGTLQRSASPLDGPLTAALARIAAANDVWLIPGSLCERGPNGELFNTAVVFSPAGGLVASYRKVFPWRPFEIYAPGDHFVVFDIPGEGCMGLSICYDAWFPETTRHLAWLGARAVVNIVKTTTPDRAQELVLARANSIVNQVVTVSVNCAGPIGQGRSIIVDAEGAVVAEAPDTATVLTVDLALGDVDRVRERGTAGLNRMWEQFHADDAPIELPLYGGRIDPHRWTPVTRTTTAS